MAQRFVAQTEGGVANYQTTVGSLENATVKVVREAGKAYHVYIATIPQEQQFINVGSKNTIHKLTCPGDKDAYTWTRLSQVLFKTGMDKRFIRKGVQLDNRTVQLLTDLRLYGEDFNHRQNSLWLGMATVAD